MLPSMKFINTPGLGPSIFTTKIFCLFVPKELDTSLPRCLHAHHFCYVSSHHQKSLLRFAIYGHGPRGEHGVLPAVHAVEGF